MLLTGASADFCGAERGGDLRFLWGLPALGAAANRRLRQPLSGAGGGVRLRAPQLGPPKAGGAGRQASSPSALGVVGSTVTEKQTCSFKKSSSNKKQLVKILGRASHGTGCPGLGSHQVESWGGGVRFTLTLFSPPRPATCCCVACAGRARPSPRG